MVGASSASETAPEDAAARDLVQQTVPCNSAVDHAGGIELTSMDSFVSTPVKGVQGARGLPGGRLSPIFGKGNAGNDDAMPLAANGSLESDAAMLLATERGGTERDDAAMLLGTTAEGPNAAMLHSDEGVAQRTESAVGSRVDDQPRRSVRLSRTYTGDETAGTSIEIRETETLARIHEHTGALLTSSNRTITADLPLVANLVNGWHKPDQTSASRILDDIRRKPGWNLGTKAEILERFAANSVPLLHKTMMLFELKEKICTILEEWMKETPPLSPKMLQFHLEGGY
jgi:hypothetical protein